MLNNEFPPLGGGTGTVNQAVLQNFSQIAGLEIDLVTSALGDRYEKEFFSDRITLHKVPVRNREIHHSSNRELIEYFCRGFIYALRLQREHRYQVCFAWSAVPAGAIALSLRKLTGLRYFLRVCGPDIPGFETRYRSILAIISPMIRTIWRNADQVIAKSDREIELIHAVDRNIDCLLVPNGVDLRRFMPRHRRDDSRPLRVICVGRLIERKGQHHLIEAVKRLIEQGVAVTLDLVGSGDARAANEAQASRLGLGDQVRFHGYVPREKIAEYYAAADVFVLPSYNEGMSVALLEAMASGLAVLVTPTGGTSELVEEGVNGGIFDWGDVERLTVLLRQFASDKNALRRMGEASRVRAQTFSWERTCGDYLKILKSVNPAGSSKPPRLHLGESRI